jgi:hypothetical protein
MNSSQRGSALRRRLASRDTSVHRPGSGSVGPGGAPASPSAAAAVAEKPTFWKVLEECPAYELPRGLVATKAPAGQVFEALTYFTDCFGTPWIAVCGSQEDVLWLPRYSPSAPISSALPQPLLAEVADAEGSALAQTCGPVAALLPPTATLNHDFGAMPDESALYGAFWAKRDWVPLLASSSSSAAGGRGDRDWNSEYQRLVDALVFAPKAAAPGVVPAAANAEDATQAVREAIYEFFTEFADACQDAISTIVGEMFAPQAERTIKAASMGVYFHRGACFRICYDTAGGVFGGDQNAMKVAAQHVRAAAHAGSVSPRFGLYQPLTFMMTHLGFRVVVTTIPPVEPARRLSRVELEPAATGPGSLLADCSRELGLKRHPVDGGPAQSHMPKEAGVYWGRDGRLYLLNIGRLLPPVAPIASLANQRYTPAVSSLFWRFRPEVVLGVSAERPISPDAFVPGSTTAENDAEVAEMTAWMRDTNIPTVAAVLGLLDPPLAETPAYQCAATGAAVEDKLGFVACGSEAECCVVSPDAYGSVMRLLYWDEQPDKAQELLDSFVKCGAPSRQPHGLIMRPDVTTVMHAHGCNLRYLPYVWAQLANLSRPCSGHYLEVEMIARAAKGLLWDGLRRATDQSERRTVCINFFLGLLQRDGDHAEQFWAESLGPAIAATFGVHTPFDMSRIDPFLVHSRVADLTGVELTTDSIASFYTDEPFVRLEAPHPRMKNARLPALVQEAGERRRYIDARGSDARRWVGKRGRCGGRRGGRGGRRVGAASPAVPAGAGLVTAPRPPNRTEEETHHPVKGRQSHT